LAIVGRFNTTRLAVLLAVPTTGVCVVVTPDVVFGLAPCVLLVTAKVTVQLPLAGIVMPVKLKAVAPAANVFGVVPVQAPPTAPPTALILLSVSVNAPPVSAEALLLFNVSVTVEVPPGAIVFGANAFAIVGAARTVRLAVLLAAPTVGVCVVVTPDVVFGCTPGVLLITAKVTVQLLLAGIVMPVKLNAVAPAASVFGVVPTQVPPTAPPTALMFVSVSVNAAPVSVKALLLLKVSVTVELPPTWIKAGTKALAMVGRATTVRLAMLLTAPATASSAVVAPEVALG